MLSTRDPNPHWFGHPASTIIYFLNAAYALYFVVGRVVGWFPDAASFAALFHADPTSFYVIGRVPLALVATAAIPLTYLVGRRLTSPAAAAVAAAIVATSPLHARFSRLIRSDALMTVFVLLAIHLAFVASGRRRLRWWIAAGACVGLATSTKWPGVLACLPVAFLAWGIGRPDALAARMRRLVAAGLAAALAFFVSAPFAVLDYGAALESIGVESGRAAQSGQGRAGLVNLWWYVDVPLRDAVGTVLLVSALGGLVALLVRNRRTVLAVLAFIVPQVIVIGMASRRYDRWVLPLIPFVAIFAAHGLATLVGALRAVPALAARREVAVVVLGCLLLVGTLQRTLAEATTVDTRTILKEWFDANVPAGTTVAVDHNASPIPRDRYVVYSVRDGRLQRDSSIWGWKDHLGDLGHPAALAAAGVTHVVVSDGIEWRTPPHQGRQWQRPFYQELFARTELLHTVPASPSLRGPTLRVYRLPPAREAPEEAPPG